VLVDEKKESGYHEVKFDGSGLSSGVYFYRFTAGACVQWVSARGLMPRSFNVPNILLRRAW
jgi:hypothetical protein